MNNERDWTDFFWEVYESQRDFVRALLELLYILPERHAWYRSKIQELSRN